MTAMAKNAEPKILLLQARHGDDPMAVHEHECFVRQTGLHSDHVVGHDLCLGPPRKATLGGYDALMVGGAGEFSVAGGTLPHFEQTLDFLREVVEIGFPMFASRFGYQCFVVALGGEVTHDPGSAEVGTFEVEVTADGASDSLFSKLPRTFDAQLGHQDRTVKQPDGIPNLASSERCALQALRVPGRPIWATQFHPELDHEANRHRYLYYLDVYAGIAGDEKKQEENFRESPETDLLLPHFLKLVLDWPR
jgi:GMP synthase (glutamine-hydrolysing)